jgi:beta-glucosidase
MKKALLSARAVIAAITLFALTTTTQLGNTPPPQNTAPQLGKNSVKEVVANMTTAEKVSLLVGMGFNLLIPGIPWPSEEDRRTPEKVPGAAGRTHAIPRLGIPSLTLSDGPAGVRINPLREGDTSKTYYATGFPIATLLASSWDTDVVNRVGVAAGRETRDYGIDILLAPAMNIHRNPLGGRNFEYYSEDPLLTGKMASSFVRGVQSNGVGTSIKHFAVNNQEFNRMQSDSQVNERALREIYLKGFEIAVKESQPWTVMSSYNLINGTYASQSSELLTTLLRGEWGFKGFVMTDWFGGNNAVEQMKAGNDMLMPGLVDQSTAMVSGIENGTLSKELLDENVTRVLNLILQSPAFKKVQYSDQPDLKTHAQVAREAATEGMVLLKTDGDALPLTASTKIALLGNSSYDLIAGGTGSGDVNKKYIVSLDQGLSLAGFTIDDPLKQSYTTYIADRKARRPKVPSFFLPPPIPEMAVEPARLEELANDTNIAIVTLGRNSGEFNDRKVDNDFTLPATEHAFIKNVSSAFHAKGKKVVVVLNVGGPIEIASWRDLVDAVLLGWQPGQEGGNSIADVLSGKVNPSGRLPTTFPMTYSDVPSATTFPGRLLEGKANLTNAPFAGRPAVATYDEGIYVGYRYYNTFGVKPAYEFGYGLSYTEFSYGKLNLSSSRFQGKVTATVTVSNTGRVPGKEVVQLYVSAPKQKLKKPDSELRAFAKTRLLKPGESQTLSFTLTASDLASFDPGTSSWVAESGTYTINAARSSLDIKSSAKIELLKDVVVAKSRKLLAPPSELKEIEPAK